MTGTASTETKGRQKSASRRPAEAVEAEDKKAAFREIMKKQVSRVALTIKHTDVQKEELRDLLAPMCHYVQLVMNCTRSKQQEDQTIICMLTSSSPHKSGWVKCTSLSKKALTIAIMAAQM